MGTTATLERTRKRTSRKSREGGSSGSQPNPLRIFQTLNAFQQTAALKAAIELDVFTAIAEGQATVPQIAHRASASERGTRILCDYLTLMGFLTKNSTHYGLASDAALFLDRRSPAYMGTIVRFLNAPENVRAYDNLAEVVRRGGTLMSAEGTITPENPLWVEFARSMAPLMVMPAETLAHIAGADAGEKCRVLDIAAGHGLFGIAIARHNPQAEIVALDWSGVLEVAKENARKAGVDGRYSTLAGSAFEVDMGSGYDLVLLTNFLHHFDPETCEKLLRKVHAALGPGGRAVTLEFVPNDDRISPPEAAFFTMIMLGTTPHGDAYTFAEFDGMFRNAGFSRSEHIRPEQTPESVIISYK
jgi:2-polyprenyl-3-methyl-5-hydroxy-6-metoxy-1,4-benzoquinol methylase